MSKRWWAVSLTAALSWNVVAKSFESPAPGHSIHGEVFNEGPRQAAYLMGDTGTVSFPITSANPEAQAFFNQGIGQLHGFWYFEAERSFRQVAMLDPNCAMAYWGMAFANIENRTRGAKFIVKATEKKASASRREQLFIDGLAEYLKDDKRRTRSAQSLHPRSRKSAARIPGRHRGQGVPGCVPVSKQKRRASPEPVRGRCAAQ